MGGNSVSKPNLLNGPKLVTVAVAGFFAGGATIHLAFHSDSTVPALRGLQRAAPTNLPGAPAVVGNATAVPSTAVATAAAPSADGVCYFVTSNLNQELLRERTRAVAETWAARVPAGSRVYYMIDEGDAAADVPLGIRGEQLVRIPGFGSHSYDDMTVRLHDYLTFVADKLDSRFPQCQWIITVDDDTYLGTRTIGRLLLDYDPRQPASMGSVYGSKLGKFVHGHFHVFSRPGVRLARRAADMCDLRTHQNWMDVQLAVCMDEASETIPEMPAAESFGRSIADNAKESDKNRIAERIGKEVIDNAQGHGCITDVHKLTADQMRAYHVLCQGLPACS